jgi:putative oxidoreductase
MSVLTVAPTRGRSVAAWTLQGLLAVAFVYFGGTKLAGGEAITASFEEIGAGQWLRYATGTTEVVGGLALLFLPLAGLAAAALAAQMAGAAVTQVAFVADGSPVLPVVLGLLALTLAWLRRDRSVETLRKLRLRLPAR